MHGDRSVLLRDGLVWADAIPSEFIAAVHTVADSFLTDALIVADCSGVVVAANAATEKLLELDAGQLLGHASSQSEWLVGSEGGLPLTSDQHPAMRTLRFGKTVLDELVGISFPGGQSSLGHTRWLNLCTYPVFGPPGPGADGGPAVDVVGVVTVLTDATDTAGGQAASNALLSHYQMLVDNTTDMVMLISPTFKLTWVSAATRHVLGYRPEDLVGTNTADLIHPDDLPVLASLRAATDQLAQGVHYELRARNSAGEYRWMSGISRVAFDRDGNAVGRISTLRDIHEQVLAQQALVESESRFRMLAENATDVVWHLASDGIMLWVSPSVCPVLGWEIAELVGTEALQLVHPDDRPALVTWRADMIAGAPVREIELRIRAADESYRWMSCQARVTRDAFGEVDGRVIGLRDVDGQVQARLALAAQSEALASSERRFRMLAQNASDVVVEVDSVGVLVWASPSIESVLGWRPEQVLGMGIIDLTHPADRGKGLRWRESVLAESTTSAVELRALCGDGSYRWMSIHARALTTADGVVTGRVIGLHDAHEQVLARQALANSQRRYKMLAENATDVVWQLDPDSVLLWVTPSIEAVLGWRPEELMGNSAIDLVYPEDLGAAQSWTADVLAGTEVAPFEIRLSTADGKFRWMSLQTRPAFEADGSVGGAVVGLRDVHEQVVAREQVARSERMFRLAMDGAPQGMAVVGLHGRFIRVNDVLCDLVGRDVDWMHEHTEYDVIHPHHLEEDMTARDRLLANEVEYDIHEGRLLTSSGEILWVQHSLALVRDEYNMPLFYVSQYQDVTGARASRQDLKYRAEHDTLTGLINRGQLQERIVDVLSRPASAVAGGVPALLFCDLDFFKDVNDAYGHASGDYM
ncbi:MAG: PAS domain S-box protein, partial [Actinomycetes bacterium]